MVYISVVQVIDVPLTHHEAEGVINMFTERRVKGAVETASPDLSMS